MFCSQLKYQHKTSMQTGYYMVIKGLSTAEQILYDACLYHLHNETTKVPNQDQICTSIKFQYFPEFMLIEILSIDSRDDHI